MTTSKAAASKKTSTKTAKTAKKTSTTTSRSTQSTLDNVVETVNKAVEDVQERTEDAVETALRFTRDASYVSLGAGFVVQERISSRNFEIVDYRVFIDEAKAKGHERAADLQHFVEPYTKRVTDVVDPITEKIEAQLPEQVRTTLQDNRKRVRELLSA